jgi:hypothetical protein
MGLQTITPRHRDLQQISIYIPFQFSINIEEPIAIVSRGEWSDLDRLFIQLWEWHSIRPKFIPMNTRVTGDQIRFLFPEITKRGIIDIPDNQCGT